MDTEKSFRLSLSIVGAMIFVVSLCHGIWHWFFSQYAEMEGLTQIQWNIINLFNWAITFFLLFMSILTFMIASKKSIPLNHLRMFSALMIGFWICRLVLELIFPVQIPFVIIPNPSLLLKILIVIGITILALPEMWLQLRSKSKKWRKRATAYNSSYDTLRLKRILVH